MRGLMNKLVSRSLSVAGKWQQQHVLVIDEFWLSENQGADLMNKYGINVPKGVAVSTIDEVKEAVKSAFPNENEVSSLNSCNGFYVALKVPVVVRLEGTNVDQGKRILKESGMTLITAEDLDDAAEKAVKAASK
ncbi:hypothetical protein GOBAR_AA26108 [Gossypium barbadense]|uniref:ATP-citrate synthase/succinyl-CoA ligase C-terminal domain-containing protein n=1 Tax=Gossypium barbadense TaxID=3634 RepID=A0A2P5WTZ0_GOSBA|nr:hypothetical protein GOBAR_AA26108 [Gossypium barbadense]